MALQNPIFISFFLPSASKSHRFVLSSSFSSPLLSLHYFIFSNSSLKLHHSNLHSPSKAPFFPSRTLCKTSEYVFPDPIPEFADSETSKFRAHLLERLSKKDIFNDSVEEVVRICTEILSNFLHTEYGGPGTLLVVPFIDMADTIQERGLPGGPQAARAAVVWAQNNIEKDWKDFTGDPNL